MAYDAHANFAVSTVATAPSPATSGTSLVVAAGEGALFPAVPFNATVWPIGVSPTAANAEIVRVTAKATDTFTITRAQESTVARTVIVGDQIASTITVKTLTDAEAYWANVVPNNTSLLGRNAANSGNVDILKINVIDEVQFDTAVRMQGNFQVAQVLVTGNISAESSTDYLPQFQVKHIGSTPLSAAHFNFQRWRAATTDVVNGDLLGTLRWQGCRSGSLSDAITITGTVTTAPSGVIVPATLDIRVTNATALDTTVASFAPGGTTLTGTLTLADATNIVLNATTGTKIGTATTQKLAFYNSTPIVQPANTTDLRTALINLGFVATGGASPLDLNGGTLTAARAALAAGTTTVAPIGLTAGTNLTSAAAGAVEFDGTAVYETVDTTSGRAQSASTHIHRLTANLGTRGGTIADYFDANSGFPTVLNGVYELVWDLYFLKTTNGTLTWTLVSTQAPTNVVTSWQSNVITGISATGAMSEAGLVTQTGTSIALPVTGSLSNATNHHHRVRALYEAGSAGNVRLRCTVSAGSLTPLRGSLFTARRLAVGNIGTFVA